MPPLPLFCFFFFKQRSRIHHDSDIIMTGNLLPRCWNLNLNYQLEYQWNITKIYHHLWWNNLWIIWSNHDIIIMVMIWWSSLKQPSPSPTASSPALGATPQWSRWGRSACRATWQFHEFSDGSPIITRSSIFSGIFRDDSWMINWLIIIIIH